MKFVIRLSLIIPLALGLYSFSKAENLFGRGAPQTILPKLYALDALEIQGGQMGEIKACRKSIQEYAHKLFVDHSAHQAMVVMQAERTRADYRNVIWSSAEARIVKTMQDTMAYFQESARGDDFDSDFLVAMRDGHAHAISLVQAAMTSENDQPLRTFLKQTLITMQSHYTEARRLLKLLEKNGGQDDDKSDESDCRGQQNGGDQGQVFFQ